ncbi:MAG: hypothetical protein HY586_07415 [Candidatus Omnitrophica bacterium]|nr:hypothetical protein [Candidatus Omnitrophota bacterium]
METRFNARVRIIAIFLLSAGAVLFLREPAASFGYDRTGSRLIAERFYRAEEIEEPPSEVEKPASMPAAKEQLTLRRNLRISYGDLGVFSPGPKSLENSVNSQPVHAYPIERNHFENSLQRKSNQGGIQ